VSYTLCTPCVVTRSPFLTWFAARNLGSLSSLTILDRSFCCLTFVLLLLTEWIWRVGNRLAIKIDERFQARDSIAHEEYIDNSNRHPKATAATYRLRLPHVRVTQIDTAHNPSDPPAPTQA